MAELEPVRLVDHTLRGQLSKQNAGRDQLVAAVMPRLPGSETIIRRIESAWALHLQEVHGRWDNEWRNLVPGADLLQGLSLAFLGRGYNTANDGLDIAKRMKVRPRRRSSLNEFIRT
jgi:hypothetical protein